MIHKPKTKRMMSLLILLVLSVSVLLFMGSTNGVCAHENDNIQKIDPVSSTYYLQNANQKYYRSGGGKGGGRTVIILDNNVSSSYYLQNANQKYYRSGGGRTVIILDNNVSSSYYLQNANQKYYRSGGNKNVSSTYYLQNANQKYYRGRTITTDQELKYYQDGTRHLKIPTVFFKKGSTKIGTRMMLLFKNQTESILEEKEWSAPCKNRPHCRQPTWKNHPHCSQPNKDGEISTCVDSLETMLNFVRSVFKTDDVKLLTTPPANLSIFEIVGEPNPISSESIIACHKLLFPTKYAVYGCHYARHAVVQLLPIKSLDGAKSLKAITVCHLNTSSWDPSGFPLRLLKMGPGGPVCHFVTTDALIWVKN